MSNSGLQEADPVAWRSVGALLSAPLDRRAAPCCGRCRSWAPSTHPNPHVTPRDRAGSVIHRTASQKGGGTQCPSTGLQHWYHTPKLNAHQIQVWKAFLLLFVALTKDRQSQTQDASLGVACLWGPTDGVVHRGINSNTDSEFAGFLTKFKISPIFCACIYDTLPEKKKK